MQKITYLGCRVEEVQQIHFVENTVGNLPKVREVMDSCFISIYKVGSFTNPFAMSTSL